MLGELSLYPIFHTTIRSIRSVRLDFIGSSRSHADMAHRMAARPKLLLRVCITHRFAYSLTRETALASCPAKSM